jgi:hypothetical protein
MAATPPPRTASRRQLEQRTYRFYAVAVATSVTVLVVGAVSSKFVCQWSGDGAFPWAELLGTLVTTLGAAVGRPSNGCSGRGRTTRAQLN